MNKLFLFLIIGLLSVVSVMAYSGFGTTDQGIYISKSTVGGTTNTYNTYGTSLTTNFYAGGNFSGVSGVVNRTLTLNNTPYLVLVDNFLLHPDIDYTLSGNTITLINNLWDDQTITVWDDLGYTAESFTGINATGVDGSISRVLVTVNPAVLVVVDNYMLHPTVDYNLVGSNITFVNNIWNDQVITTWG